MTKKHKITKRFLAFALSVAMIVTFTPTSFLAYAENPTKEAAVEEPAAEPTAPAEDVVKEEPTGEDAVQEEDQTMDEVVEEKAEKDAKEDVKEDDIPVYAGIRILQDAQHKTYNGEEQSIKYSASELESLYEVVYQVGDEQVESLPEGFDVEVLFTDIHNGFQLNTKKGIVIKGTDAGRYGAVVRARISGSAPGYYIPKTKVIDNSIEMVIDPREVTVNAKGKTEEITYDGRNHYLNMYELSCDDELYDVDKYVREVEAVKPVPVRDVGKYTTEPMNGYENTNPNFDVIFAQSTGTLTIKPAPLTIYTDTGRTMVNPDSEKTFMREKAWIKGLVGKDEEAFALTGDIMATGALPVNKVGSTVNTYEVQWGDVEDSINNYDITEELGTMTVFAQNEVQVEILGNTNDKKYIYDGATHSVEGWYIDDIDNPLFEDIYKHSDGKVVVFNGNSRVEEVNAGFYPMGLTADMFSIDKSFEGAQDFNVTFIVKDGGLTIDKRALTVTISPNNERYPYTGQEYSMRAFNWSYSGALEEVGYTEDYIDYDGDNVIKGTEIGIYSETLRLEKFHNNNDNYNVTFRLSNSPFGPRPHKEDSKTATAAKDAKEDVTEYTSSLEIFRPVVIVRIHGNTVDVPYDGTEHALKIDADSNKAFLDGAEQEGSGFTVESVSNKYEVPFDESKIFLRSNITLSGTDVGVYRERGWASRLSYDDPNVAVEFETTPMILHVTPKKLTLVVDDQEVTYEGKPVFEYENELTAHYEGLPEGEEGPEFKVFFAGFVKDELPEGAAEQHYLDAEILSDPGQYDIEVKRGIFTLKKRPVTVTVTGDKVRVPYNGEQQYLDVNVDELDMNCDDELYDLGFVEVKERDKLQAKGKDPDQYPIGLEEKLELINHDECFDVNFVINDGYLEIVADSTPIDIGEINVEGGTFEYDGEVHPAQLANDEVTVGDKTYKIKKPKFQYIVISCESEIPDFMEEPVYAGEYSADIDKFKVFDGDVDVTAFCDFERGDSATITITPRPINIKITGAKVKKVYTGDRVVWPSSAEIEILNPISNEPEDTGYWEVLNQRFLTFDGGTVWPMVEGDIPGERYNMGLDKALDHNLFVNNNPNYEVVEFIIEDGYMDLVGEDEMFDLPNPTPINEEFTYDGKAHFIHRNFEELQDDGSFEITGSDGNTYTVKPKFRAINFLEGGYVRAGIYRWYRTVNSVKVFDEDGFDVTNLVNDSWAGRQFSGTLTIKPITANVTVKGDVAKTYGDPDPDESTWVTVEAKDKASESVVKRSLFIHRVPGENVGKYEIRVSLPQVADEPDPGAVAVKDDSQEAAKKAAKRASEEVKEVIPGEEVERPKYEKITIQEEKWTSFDLTVDDEDKFFTINKAPLTISANDDEKDFGTEDPTLTATVSKGLVGSESLPKNFYSVYRDKGEDVKMLPDDWYVIHVDAQNVDVDWDAETHYFKDEGLLPPPEEAYAQAEAAQEAVAKEEAAWEYAAKSMKAARALSAVKAEKQVVVFPESIAEAVEFDPPSEEAWEKEAAEVAPETPSLEKYDITSFTEFNPMNYDIRTVNGKFNINGDSPSVDDPDEPDEPIVTADTDDSNNSGNKGNSSSTGDEFGLMDMMLLLTASLIGLLALVSRRRREQE